MNPEASKYWNKQANRSGADLRTSSHVSDNVEKRYEIVKR